MSTAGSSDGRRRAVTLLELLVVISLVAGVIVMAGWGLRPDRSRLPMQAAQAEVAGLLAMTRSHASREGRPARLMVHLDPLEPRAYLRQLIVALEEDSARGWRLLDAPHLLPPGVAVVPPADVPTLAGAAWPPDRRSRFSAQAVFALEGQEPAQYGAVQYAAAGTVFGSPMIVLGAIRTSVDGPQFDVSRGSHSFLLRGSGNVTQFTAVHGD